MSIDAAAIPTVTLDAGTHLTRITQHRSTGESSVGWYFSSTANVRPGRFDLPHPDGTCHLASDLTGAFNEVFRGTGLIDRRDIARRSVLAATTTERSGPWANLTDPAAATAGVNMDVYAGDDYTRTQQLASDSHAHHRVGVIALLRQQSDGERKTYALFGDAGLAQDVPTGWSSTQSPLADHLDELGSGSRLRIVDIPRALTASNPPR